MRVPRKSNDTSDGAMETRSERGKTEPIVDKIRRGEVSVFVAVAEELPEVFRTHVVPKLGLHETLKLAHSEQVLQRGGVERGGREVAG